jgi:hypothetical protein
MPYSVNDIPNPASFRLRSYAMIACGPTRGATGDLQRDPQNGLPDLTQPGMGGVGIYWETSDILTT